MREEIEEYGNKERNGRKEGGGGEGRMGKEEESKKGKREGDGKVTERRITC